MPDEPTPGNPAEVIDIVNANGEGARIRERDFEAWSAKGFVRGLTYPAPTPPPVPPAPSDPPANPNGG